MTNAISFFFLDNLHLMCVVTAITFTVLHGGKSIEESRMSEEINSTSYIYYDLAGKYTDTLMNGV